MPPVREASTKPSAATVLPAPVACSNQKRLAALGSSTSSETSSSGSDQSTRLLVAVLVLASSSGSSSSPGRPAGASSSGSSETAPLDRPLPLRCASASSAVSVPDSASTWWADSTVPSTSAGSSWESRRSRPSSSDQRRRQRWRARCGPRRARPARSRARGAAACPGASADAASSPSSRKGSRANELARSRSSEEGRVATARVAVSGSAMKARLIDVGRSRRPPHDFEQARDRNGDGVIRDARPGSNPYSSRLRDGHRRSATVCPDATLRRHPRRPRADRGPGRRSPPGGRRQPPEAQVRPRPGRAQADRRPRPAGRRCTTSPPQLLPGGPKAFRARLASLKGYPVVVNKWASWCARAARSSRSSRQAVSRASRSRSSASTPATRPSRRRFLAGAAALPLLPRPRRGHREVDPGAGQLPDHRLLRPPRQARLRAPGRYRNQSDLADDMRALPVLTEFRRPRDEQELAAALALREEVFCGEQGVSSTATATAATPRRCSSSPSTARWSARAGC